MVKACKILANEDNSCYKAALRADHWYYKALEPFLSMLTHQDRELYFEITIKFMHFSVEILVPTQNKDLKLVCCLLLLND